jgi:fatty acid desaturase
VNAMTTGMFAGLLLGVAAAAGGFSGFLVALGLGALGLLVAGHLAGELDVRGAVRGRERD